MGRLDRLIEEAARPDSPPFPKEVVADLMERKLRLFPDDDRFIADFHLKPAGHRFEIIVATAT